jgi:sugar phosphate isomerase/epimerase
MQLAFSTNAFTRFSLSRALAQIRAAGFPAAEILADEPHAYPAKLTPEFHAAVRDDLQRLHLAVSNVNVNCTFGYFKDAPAEAFFEPSLISPNPQHREDRIALIARAMRFARAAGAANVSITSGKMLGPMNPARSAAAFEQSIARVLALADEHQLNVGIECEPGLFIESVAELRQWIDRLAHPRLGANLDIGHCQVLGESIPAAIDLLADRLWNLHVEDIPGRKHYHLIPGQGTLDWPAVLAALRAIGYARYLTVELYTHTEEPRLAADQSFAFLNRLLET